MKKKYLQVFGFIAGIIVLLFCFIRIFEFKHGDGIYPWTIYYELEKEPDVLIFGSSRAFEGINPAILWENYGLASFELCGAGQPMWNSYFSIKESIKEQKPKLIVLEAGMLDMEGDYSWIDSEIIKNTFGYNPSPLKREAISVSAPPDRQEEFTWEFLQYHSRYKELGYNDFKSPKDGGYYKGFSPNFDQKNQKDSRNKLSEETYPLTPKVEEYYRKIMELSIEEEIPLFIVVTPYSVREEIAVKKQNQGKIIAEEYGIPFVDLNFMYDELQFKFDEDLADSYHLNYYGNQKVTDWLGAYITEHYDVPDRRGEKGYESWNQNSLVYYKKLKRFWLKREENPYNYITQLKEGYTLVITVNGENSAKDSEIQRILSSLGIQSGLGHDTGSWVIHKNQYLYHNNNNEYLWYMELGENDIAVRGAFDESDNQSHQIIYNRTEYIPVKDGINILVYDDDLGELVECIGISVEDTTAVQR